MLLDKPLERGVKVKQEPKQENLFTPGPAEQVGIPFICGPILHQMPVLHFEPSSLADFQTDFLSSQALSLHPEARQRMASARTFLLDKLKRSERPIYGINTGFGKLCKEEIAPADLELLQINLVRSHACGVGKEIPGSLARLMLLLKLKSFTTGHSAISVELMDRLLDYYNSGAEPVVFEKGSLGASGDLVPLAHMVLPLLGLGEVVYQGKRMSGAEYLTARGQEPVRLQAKEGLALLNGTQFMLAHALDSIWRAERLFENSLWIFSVAIDAFDGRTDFLHPGIQQVRPHKGQILAAEKIRNYLKNSPIANQSKTQVQDPYSLRCLPQVLGASYDAIQYVKGVFETELNSITDNPLVFEEEDLVISGGNFHGQPLALALDFLAIAVAEIANIGERLLYQLLSGERGLPVFLTKNPGLESGFMIPQYAAASLVSQNKQLCTPASVDSIVSSNGQEDHVSMGANAGLKCRQVLENAESVMGIFWLTATQALEFRRPAQTAPELEKRVAEFRKQVPVRDSDAYFKPDMDKATIFVQNQHVVPTA